MKYVRTVTEAVGSGGSSPVPPLQADPERISCVCVQVRRTSWVPVYPGVSLSQVWLSGPLMFETGILWRKRRAEEDDADSRVLLLLRGRLARRDGGASASVAAETPDLWAACLVR